MFPACVHAPSVPSVSTFKAEYAGEGHPDDREELQPKHFRRNLNCCPEALPETPAKASQDTLFFVLEGSAPWLQDLLSGLLHMNRLASNRFRCMGGYSGQANMQTIVGKQFSVSSVILRLPLTCALMSGRRKITLDFSHYTGPRVANIFFAVSPSHGAMLSR